MKANIYKLKTLQVKLKPYIKNGWKHTTFEDTETVKHEFYQYKAQFW